MSSADLSSLTRLPPKGELEEIWLSIAERKQLQPTAVDAQLQNGLGTMFDKCIKHHSSLPLKTSKISDKVRDDLLMFVENHLEHSCTDEESPKWSVNVVLGNCYTKKSLEVITELKLSGRPLQFDLDMLGKLRQQLASAVVAIERISRL